MKRRIINLLGGLFLLSMFTVGCVDIKEPAGIQEIRSAKAEFFKADAAVKLAEAKYRDAQTAQETAKAKGLEIDNQMKTLNYERQKAQDDYTKAQIDGQIKVLQITLQSTILDAQQKLAVAQHQYNVALAQLDIAKKLDIPAAYKNALDGIMFKLWNILGEMTQTENNISNYNRDLIQLSVRDSAISSNRFRDNIKQYELTLAANQKILATAKLAASTSSATELKTQLDGVNATIATMKGDISANNSKLATANNEHQALLTKQANYCFLLGIINTLPPFGPYFKQDYTAKIMVPVVAEIVTAIKGSPDFRQYLSADNLSLSFFGSLPNLIVTLDKFKTWITDNKTATEGWTALEDANKAELKKFTETQTKLTAELTELLNAIEIKNNEISTLNSQVSLSSSSLGVYNRLASEIQGKIDGYLNSINIADAENAVRNSQVNLDIAKSMLDSYLKGDLVSMKNQIENQIKAEQIKLAGYKVLFDQATKDKDALIAIINGLNK